MTACGQEFTDAAGCVWVVVAATEDAVAVMREGDPEPVTMPTYEWEAVKAALAQGEES